MINNYSLTRLALVTGIILTLPLHAETRKKVPASEESEEAPADDKGSLFPDWTADRFDWKVGPILGVRARNTEYGGVKYETLSSEIGLGARVRVRYARLGQRASSGSGRINRVDPTLG